MLGVTSLVFRNTATVCGKPGTVRGIAVEKHFASTREHAVEYERLGFSMYSSFSCKESLWIQSVRMEDRREGLVETCKPRGNSSGATDTLIMSNLTDSVTEEGLATLLSEAGAVKVERKSGLPMVKLFRDKEMGDQEAEVVLDDPRSAAGIPKKCWEMPVSMGLNIKRKREQAESAKVEELLAGLRSNKSRRATPHKEHAEDKGLMASKGRFKGVMHVEPLVKKPVETKG